MARADATPWRDRSALAALAPLGVLLAAVILYAPWYSNFGVDSMTLWEQVRAVADHGSIDFDNGPAQEFSELRTRWFVAAHGRSWGILPAPLTYVLAPAARLGGFRGVIRMIWLLFGCTSLVTYALLWRMTGRRWVAVAAAYQVVLGASFVFWASMVAPFVPAAAFSMLAVYLAYRSFECERSKLTATYALGAGLCASLALGSHLLLAIPWGLMGLVCVALGTWRARLVRGALYGLASMPALGLMSWVNHQRFNTWNPVSYGPCSTFSCEGNEAVQQNADAFVQGLRPLAPWIAAWLLALWCVRRSSRAAALVAFAGPLSALLLETPLRDKWIQWARTLYGFVFYFGTFTTEFPRTEDLMCSFQEGYCTRSLLQCAPVLVLAFLAARSMRETSLRSSVLDDPGALAARAARWMLIAIVGGSLMACTLRAETTGAHVWGWPFINIRYVTPLMPAALVLAALAVSEFPWAWWHAVLVVVLAIHGARTLYDLDDLCETRRVWTHIVPLELAIFTLTSVVMARMTRGRAGLWAKIAPHVAALAVVACMAYAAVLVVCVDVKAAHEYRARQTARTEELARCVTAPRFILLGGYALDETLALHDTRDIFFINVGMGPQDGSGARTLLTRYMTRERPAFLIQDNESGPWYFDWPGWHFETIEGCPRIRRIVRD